MIVEKMLEAIILERIIKCNMQSHNNTFKYKGKEYDFNKILERFEDLKIEFIEPYAVNNAVKTE